MKHRYISSNSRTLFFTTSPRSPSKLIPEVKLLIETCQGKTWNRETQAAFMEKLSQQTFFQQVAPTKNLDLSARDRINRGPQLLGFVNLESTVQPTDAYKKLIFGKRTDEVFLRQMLKFQVPSPLKPESKNASPVFWCRPYLEILRLIYDMDYLSRDELAIFGMQLTNISKFDLIKNKIKNFRFSKKNRKPGRYQEFAQTYAENEVSDLFADVIESGNIEKRENKGKQTTVSEFVSTKLRNMYDYADACRRYLRVTGLIEVDIQHRSVTISPKRKADVEWILNNVNRQPVFVDDLEKYQSYLFDSNLPVLYSDNKELLCSRLSKLGQNAALFANDDLDTLKDKYETALRERTKQSIKQEEEVLKTYQAYDDIMAVFNSLNDRQTPDKPLLLEWNTWRAMTMIDHGIINGNFARDLNGLPEDTAGPGVPDIVCQYKDFDLVIEVTMQTGTRQYNSEGEPVADHVGVHRLQSRVPTYGIFIAPKINPNVITYFYGINQMKMKNYGGKSQIVPMTIDMFEQLVESSEKAIKKPTAEDIKAFLDKSIQDIDDSKDEMSWFDSIRTNIDAFINQVNSPNSQSVNGGY